MAPYSYPGRSRSVETQKQQMFHDLSEAIETNGKPLCHFVSIWYWIVRYCPTCCIHRFFRQPRSYFPWWRWFGQLPSIAPWELLLTPEAARYYEHFTPVIQNVLISSDIFGDPKVYLVFTQKFRAPGQRVHDRSVHPNQVEGSLDLWIPQIPDSGRRRNDEMKLWLGKKIRGFETDQRWMDGTLYRRLSQESFECKPWSGDGQTRSCRWPW